MLVVAVVLVLVIDGAKANVMPGRRVIAEMEMIESFMVIYEYTCLNCIKESL